MKKLTELFDRIDIKRDIEIKGISIDSRTVKKGNIFFALPGTKDDGTKYAIDAVKNGAVCVVAEKNIDVGVPVIVVKNIRKVLSDVSNRFYNYPSNDLEVVGVTGTNGKTTTTYILKHLMSDKKVGIIGTISHIICDKTIKASHTTPESFDIFQMMKDHIRCGGDAIAMEVSSHAIYMERVRGTSFDGVIFTNLSRDHLDFHKTMDEYFKVKKRLFTELSNDKTIKIINIDDSYGEKLYREIKNNPNVYTFGRRNDADLRWRVDELSMKGTRITFIYDDKEIPVFSPLLSNHNVCNLAGALLYALKSGRDKEELVHRISTIPHVKGRIETIQHNNRFFVVDYAHTPDAMKNVLKGIREVCKGRIITVFGAGGDRDRGKRPEMGKVADALSDVVIVTSDNPRTEDPMAIINDILKGITRKENLFVIEDRYEAIKKSVEISKDNDVVLICGKGHEDYQILKDKTIHFSDIETVKEILGI